MERRRLGSQGLEVSRIGLGKHVRFLEENVGAVEVELSADDLARIAQAFPKGATAGERYVDTSTVNV